MEFAKKLNRLRRLRRYSQETLGRMVGCSQNAIGKWCRGESMPTLAMALKLAEALKVDLDYLADDLLDRIPDEPAEVVGKKMIRTLNLSETQVIWRLGRPDESPANPPVIPRHLTLGPDGRPADAPGTPEKAPKKTPR